MNCNECSNQLERWLTSALAEEQAPITRAPEDIAEHARGCATCRKRLDAAMLLLRPDDLQATPPDDLADRVKARLHEHQKEQHDPHHTVTRFGGSPGRGQRVVRYAMAAAVLVVVLLSGLMLGRTFPGAPEDGMGSRIADGNGTGEPSSQGEDRVVRVEFRLEAPDAQAVAVVGDWNGWDAEANPLSDTDADGIWETTITLRPDEEYQYQFLIDDQMWVPDPSSSLTVDDGFGGTNSVLNI